VNMANEIQMVIITSRFIKLLLVDCSIRCPQQCPQIKMPWGLGIQSIQI